MAGSKPEELVAKLYEEGMTDDEVKAQLIEFGLSSREIHVLIKRARELMGKEAKEMPAEVKKEAGRIQEAKPAEKPVEKKGEPGEKKSRFGGFFGKKEKTAGEAPGKAVESAEKPVVEKPAEMTRNVKPSSTGESEKVDRLLGLISAPQSEAPIEKVSEAPPAEAKPQEKKRFGFLGGKKEEKPKEEKPKEVKLEKKPEPPKDAKGKQAAVSREMEMQAKMKRLAMIKEAIGKPVTEHPSSQPPREPGSELEIPKLICEPGEAKKPSGESKLSRLTGKISLGYSKKQLTPEEEEKMDEELAKKLIKGMDNIENEMSELKQLLETLRELNIKLIEILESK